MNNVTPVYGRPLCYRVKSRKTDDEYFCDLTAHNGNGFCTCDDYACRVVANMKRPHELLSNETLCWHLRQCHLHFMSGVLEEILSQ